MQRRTCFFLLFPYFWKKREKQQKSTTFFLLVVCFFFSFFSFFHFFLHLLFRLLFFAFSNTVAFSLHLLGDLVLHLLFPIAFFWLLFFNCVFFRIILSGWHKSTIFSCDYDIEWQTCSARIINPNKKVLVQLSLRILWCQENRWWWTHHCGRTFGASWQGQHLTILTYFDFPKSNQRDKRSQFPSSLIERLPRTLMSDSLYTTLCLTMKSLHRSRVYLTLFDYTWPKWERRGVVTCTVVMLRQPYTTTKVSKNVLNPTSNAWLVRLLKVLTNQKQHDGHGSVWPSMSWRCWSWLNTGKF